MPNSVLTPKSVAELVKIVAKKVEAGEQRIRELEDRVAEAEAKQRIDEQQCDDMTTHAGALAMLLNAAEQRLKALEGIALGGKLCISQQHADLEQRLKEAREALAVLFKTSSIEDGLSYYRAWSPDERAAYDRLEALVAGDAPNGSSE